MACSSIVTLCLFWLQAEIAAANVHPLLERLAAEPEPLLRRSLLTLLAALAAPGSSTGAFPEALWDPWTERVRPYS